MSSRTTMPAISAPRRTIGLAGRSDTADLWRSEEPRWPPQQDEQQHDVGNYLAQAAAQERQLVLIAGGEGDRHADHQPADDSASDRVKAAEHGGWDRREGEQVRRRAHTGRREAREERA